MGCTQSKIDGEEPVARCKSRKRFIKQAVQHRHEFAAAHATYIRSLKNTGAALRQFGDAEAKDVAMPITPTFVLRPAEPPLPPPPPPPPAALATSPPRPPLPIARAVSMPQIALRTAGASPKRSPMMSPSRTVKEEEEEEEEEEDRGYYVPPPPRPPVESHNPPPPPPPPPRDAPWDPFYVFTPTYQVHDTITSEVQEAEYEPADTKTTEEENGGPEEVEQKEEEQAIEDPEEKAPEAEPETVEEQPEPASAEKKGVNELQIVVTPKRSGKALGPILADIDDQFLAAHASGKQVSELLEARRVHYHTNFAEGNGIIDHHAKVLNLLTWSKSLPTKTPLANEDANDRAHGEKESHASTLDKLLAWEKKLYDEVKAGEVIRIELEKKSSQLKNQKDRGDDPMAIEKTKALVQSLQTRYLVEFQAVDSASLEVQKLRDEHLYPQLVALVQGLTKMWKTMLECHEKQCELIPDLKALENSSDSEETSEFHRKITEELETEINAWHQNLENLITSQKAYTTALNGWLRFNMMPIETEVKDKLASPQKMASTPVYHLCRAWIQALDKLPGEAALQALKGFSELLHEMVTKQAEEVKQKKRHETLAREHEKKMHSLLTFERKYTEKHMDQKIPDEKQELVIRNPVQERKAVVDVLKKRVEEEKEKHVKLCSQNSNMTLSSLQNGLPPVLQSITTFARKCTEAYTGLHEFTVNEKLP